LVPAARALASRRRGRVMPANPKEPTRSMSRREAPSQEVREPIVRLNMGPSQMCGGIIQAG